MNFKRKYPTPPQDKKKALEAALTNCENILAYADNSEKMLRFKLKERGYGEETVDEVIAVLVGHGLLDEIRAASNTIHMLSKKLYGKQRIKAVLFSKGFSSETVSEAFKGCEKEIDFGKNCLTALEKLGGEKNQKTYNKLRYYGFSYENISYAYENISG